jgi:hypothetical protein
LGGSHAFGRGDAEQVKPLGEGGVLRQPPAALHAAASGNVEPPVDDVAGVFAADDAVELEDSLDILAGSLGDPRDLLIREGAA